MSTLEQTDLVDTDRPTATARSPIRAGIEEMIPFIVGYAPFALVIGSAVAEQGAPVAGWAGSWLIYGGSAHLAAVRAADAGVAVAVATGLLINARLLVYSAALAQQWRHQPRWFRVVAAALVIDPTWALSERNADRGASLRDERKYFLAAGLTLGVGWSAMIAVGVLAGGRLGAAELEIAVPLCLIANIGPRLEKPGYWRPALIAAVVAVATSGFPAGTGVLCAAVGGCVVGAVAPPSPRSGARR